jgi:protein-disulfide isomerase
MLALAVEAAAARGRFWTLTRELLLMRHHDPPDLDGAFVRSFLEPDAMRAAMRAGAGADTIAADVASALPSGVIYSPALFINGERYRGELDSAAAGIDAAVRAS